MKTPIKQTDTLFELQSLDTQRDRMRKRLKEIDEELKENEAVAEAEAALAEAEEERRHWQTRKTDLTLERESLQTEAEKTEARLYSGEVNNPRELEELQEKVEELKRRYETLAEPEAEAELMLEEKIVEAEKAEAHAEQIRQEQADTLSGLADEKKRVKKRIGTLTEKIEAVRERILNENLDVYDELRRKKEGGVAVAAIRGEECTGCGMQLTTRVLQRARRGSVVNCPTCGRIAAYKPTN